MELALRDMKIFQMKAEIENRKKMLCSKRKQLLQTKRENKFLVDVFEDYEKYNKQIVHENERKIKFFEQLHDYIDRITYDLKLTDNKLKESQMEQRDIMKEINILKSEIDDLIDVDE